MATRPRASSALPQPATRRHTSATSAPDAAADSSAPPARRGRGRPRSERRSERVLAAALEEITSVGIGALTMEGVAAAAGVSKVTVYRRWPDKIALVLAALESLPELPVPDTGSLLGDLRKLRNDLVHLVTEWHLGDVIASLMAERRHSEHRDAIRHYIDQRSEPFTIIVRRARARGELRTTMPDDLVALLFSAPLSMSILNRDTPLTDREWRRVVTTIINGLQQPGGTS